MRLKKIITILIINLLFYNISHGENSFTFDVAEIEILEEGNIFLGKEVELQKLKMVLRLKLKILNMISLKIFYLQKQK